MADVKIDGLVEAWFDASDAAVAAREAAERARNLESSSRQAVISAMVAEGKTILDFGTGNGYRLFERTIKDARNPDTTVITEFDRVERSLIPSRTDLEWMKKPEYEAKIYRMTAKEVTA